MLDTIINKFKSVCLGFQQKKDKIQMEGFILSHNKENEKTYILIKTGERVWKSVWLSDKEYSYSTPTYSLQSVFINKA